MKIEGIKFYFFFFSCSKIYEFKWNKKRVSMPKSKRSKYKKSKTPKPNVWKETTRDWTFVASNEKFENYYKVDKKEEFFWKVVFGL